MIYLNEFDPFASAWLGELMGAGHIPQGRIDTRSIVNVQPGDLDGCMNPRAVEFADEVKVSTAPLDDDFAEIDIIETEDDAE